MTSRETPGKSLSRLRVSGRDNPQSTLRIRLATLRSAAANSLIFILLQPALEFKKSHVLKNTIAVLVDDTKSMSIKTFPSEQSRVDFVRQAFEKNQGVLESLANIFQLDYYLISDQIERTSSLSSGGRYSPKKTNTDFETVFSKLKTRYDGKSLQGSGNNSTLRNSTG